jgi:hypothetical protein
MMEQRRKKCLANFFLKRLSTIVKKTESMWACTRVGGLDAHESVVHARWCVEHTGQMELVG